ncbi:hypothetical protein JCM11491_003792 [Sporobolomyces phaffii]
MPPLARTSSKPMSFGRPANRYLSRGCFGENGEVWCFCNTEPRVEALRRVTRKESSPNLGREFYSCGNWQEPKCEFFLWVDESAQKGRQNVTPPPPDAAGSVPPRIRPTTPRPQPPVRTPTAPSTSPSKRTRTPPPPSSSSSKRPVPASERLDDVDFDAFDDDEEEEGIDDPDSPDPGPSSSSAAAAAGRHESPTKRARFSSFAGGGGGGGGGTGSGSGGGDDVLKTPTKATASSATATGRGGGAYAEIKHDPDSPFHSIRRDLFGDGGDNGTTPSSSSSPLVPPPSSPAVPDDAVSQLARYLEQVPALVTAVRKERDKDHRWIEVGKRKEELWRNRSAKLERDNAELHAEVARLRDKVRGLEEQVTELRTRRPVATGQIVSQLVREPYTPSSWSTVALHPVPGVHSERFIVEWVFLVSSLNFSFWSTLGPDERYGVTYKSACDGKATDGDGDGEGVVWTGYFSLLAALHRALEDGVDVTNPTWYGRDATDDELRRVFRSDPGREELPLLDERIRVLRQVGGVLCDKFDGSFTPVLDAANHSALALVETVTALFPSYDDVARHPALVPPEPVPIRKRAQILVAELWAAFGGRGRGRFDDIDQVSMFADYRVPQVLHSLGTLAYDQHVTDLLERGTDLAPGSVEEVEIRCASIVVVEEIKAEIERLVERDGDGDGDVAVEVPNSVLLDFLLWDLAKAEEARGRASLPHHRTRSVFY